MDSYRITIAGVPRDLPLCPINDQISIAAFIMLGDVEMTLAAAEALLTKCPPHDIVVTAEAKGIPLAYEMARRGCGRYLVARKSTKLYMKNPIGVSVRSISTDRLQTLCLDENEMASLRGLRVLVVDDVISTGDSLRALEKLITQAGGNIVAKAAVLAEGDAIMRDDILYLEPLPLFKNGEPLLPSL